MNNVVRYALILLGGSAVGIALAAAGLWVTCEAFDGRLIAW